MLESLFQHRILGILVGLFVAGAVGVLATIAGVPEPYPIVLALAVYVPFGSIVGASDRFDREAYVAHRGRAGVAVDVALTVAAAFAGGAAVAVLVGARLQGFLLVAVIAVGAFLGGQLTFFARSLQFHSPDREPDAETE